MVRSCSLRSSGPQHTHSDAEAIEARALWLGKLASSALIDEVTLTPKPALVDQRGSGAHTDLTIQSMIRSAQTLEPYFQAAARLSHGRMLDVQLREDLSQYGRDAEQAMLAATGGSNSHRGAIWCVGLLVASAAMHRPGASEFDIADTAGQLACMRDQFAPNGDSHGQFIKRAYGIDGARAEAQKGFPHATRIGLPYLRQRRLTGTPELACRLDALLMIMSTLNDTCLLYRGGLRALEVAKTGAQEVIALGGTSQPQGMARLFQLDRDLLRLGASPGGSADLLAATLFLDALSFPETQSATFGSVMFSSQS